jgi:hypothetical protein
MAFQVKGLRLKASRSVNRTPNRRSPRVVGDVELGVAAPGGLLAVVRKRLDNIWFQRLFAGSAMAVRAASSRPRG